MTETLLKLAPLGLAVSLISYGELFEGAFFSRDPVNALDALRTFLAATEIVSLTPAIMEQFAQIRGRLPRRLRQQIGDMDLLIAATAVHHGMTLLTRNIRDFQPIPDVTIFQPN